MNLSIPIRKRPEPPTQKPDPVRVFEQRRELLDEYLRGYQDGAAGKTPTWTAPNTVSKMNETLREVYGNPETVREHLYGTGSAFMFTNPPPRWRKALRRWRSR